VVGGNEKAFGAPARAGDGGAARRREVGEAGSWLGARKSRVRCKVGSAADPTFKNAPTLAEQGIDEHLADRARKLAATPTDKFEADVAKPVAIPVAAG
jgi:hypothetical protein